METITGLQLKAKLSKISLYKYDRMTPYEKGFIRNMKAVAEHRTKTNGKARLTVRQMRYLNKLINT